MKGDPRQNGLPSSLEALLDVAKLCGSSQKASTDDNNKERYMGKCAVKRKETTLEDLVDVYLEDRLLRPATVTTYREAVRRWVKETGIYELNGIERDVVLGWRNAILARARPETWNKYRRHLRALMNYAIDRGWTSSNPFKEVPPARTGHRLKKTVDSELLIRALKLLNTQADAEPEEGKLRPAWFWAMVIRAFYYTGVRRRQIVELRWGDFDMVNGVWRIRAETCKTHREWMVPLAPEVLEDLMTLYERTEARIGGKPSPAHQIYNVTLFYPKYKGRRMRVDQVGGFFHRLSKELGERITPHRLRHTMATLLAAQGDIRTLQELLGHTNISTTMGYVHPDVDRMRSLVSHLPGV
ncbi:tyrosine-type recombinase/integrase [Thioalbus denitrificans]|nr:site-specific integrase [Thioalbus denitrificans]